MGLFIYTRRHLTGLTKTHLAVVAGFDVDMKFSLVFSRLNIPARLLGLLRFAADVTGFNPRTGLPRRGLPLGQDLLKDFRNLISFFSPASLWRSAGSGLEFDATLEGKGT